MLRFHAFNNGQPASNLDLASTHLVGSDSVPLRADIGWKGEFLVCDKRAAGPAGLAILWHVEGAGTLLLETPRLLERESPYIVSLELARGHLMRINHKREEWGLHDAPDSAEVNAEITAATELLIAGLNAESPVEASEHGDKALAQAVRISEDLTHRHSTILLERRKDTAGFSRRVFGCQIETTASIDRCGKLLTGTIDFASLPIHWKQVEPTERKYNWKPLDNWIEWFTKNRIPVKASELVCFAEHAVPDWLYIWEHDFETIRDLVAEHIRRVVNRYGNYIQVWDVVTGLHAVERFSFNFEQIMELTRMAATITRQLAPRSTTIVDIVAPWGEYYARNQRTIPPMLYVDMAIQSGINFDAIGLQFIFGAGTGGSYVRDMFQISSLIDKFGNFGRPIHITAVQVPSAADAPASEPANIKGGGTWHSAWDETVQAQWLREFCETALARPFVETVTWRNLTDAMSRSLPHGGLVTADLVPKKAFAELASLRKEIVPGAVRS